MYSEWLNRLIAYGAPLHRDYGFYIDNEAFRLPYLIYELGLVTSISEAHRQIKQGSIKINGEQCKDKQFMLSEQDKQLVTVPQLLRDHKYSFDAFLAAMGYEYAGGELQDIIIITRGKSKFFILCYDNMLRQQVEQWLNEI